VPLIVKGFPGPVAKVVFNIDGATCSADDGATTVGVDHTWVGDLTFRLTSPGGRSATPIDAPGGQGNSGNNFCQTVLDDAAPNPIQGIGAGQAPFTGTFKPLQPASVFVGGDPNGTWKVHVTDNAVLDTGNVRAFSLDLSGFTCAP